MGALILQSCGRTECTVHYDPRSQIVIVAISRAVDYVGCCVDPRLRQFAETRLK